MAEKSTSTSHGLSSSSVSTSSGAERSSSHKVSYRAESVVGTGTFGVVFKAIVQPSNEVVAIKKVLQDKRFKNRELEIMRQIPLHPNVVKLTHVFYSTGDNPDDLYLNLVMEFVPDTLHATLRRYRHEKKRLHPVLVKSYVYQLAKALDHIHSLGICHRDIKPQNLLVDPKTNALKLCDLGSAKILVQGQPNVSYICSRYYRAPELIFGASYYSTSIDVWSFGCVAAEAILLRPLFTGDNGVEQLVSIVQVLGTPSKDELESMNASYKETNFPIVEKADFRRAFSKVTEKNDDILRLIELMFAYDPQKRLMPRDVLDRREFDDLRTNTDARLARYIPQGLFDLNPQGGVPP